MRNALPGKTVFGLSRAEYAGAHLRGLLFDSCYFVIYDPLIAASLITSVLAACYIGAMLFRLAALILGSKAKVVEQAQMLRAEWPMYTVLVPCIKRPLPIKFLKISQKWIIPKIALM